MSNEVYDIVSGSPLQVPLSVMLWVLAVSLQKEENLYRSNNLSCVRISTGPLGQQINRIQLSPATGSFVWQQEMPS